MKIIRKMGFCYLIIFMIIITFATIGISEEISAQTQYHFTMGCASITSSYYALQSAAAKIADEFIPGVTFTAMESGGGTDNLKRILNNQLDAGGVPLESMYEAFHGTGKWKGSPQPNITRTLFTLTVNYNPIWVNKDKGINSVADLEGKSFYSGMPGSSTQTTFAKIEEILGLNYKSFIGSLSDAVAAIKDRRVVGMIKAVAGNTLGSAIMDIRSRIELNYFGFSDEEVEMIRREAPWITLSTIPAGFFKEYPEAEPATIIASRNMLTVRNDFPEEIAYQWTKAAANNWHIISDVFAGALAVDIVRDTVSDVASAEGIYLHPGAIRYYREMGVAIPESLIPPEMN